MFDPKSAPPTNGRMASLFCKLVIPAMFTNVLGFCSVLANAIFAGRMNDPTKLAVVGLTSVCHNLLLLSLLIGLNSAQETLTSQAFGAGNIRLCSIYLNRGFFILIAFFIPLAVIPSFFSEGILVGLGQDPEVARLVNIQIWYGLPAVFFYGQYDLIKRWLAC